MASSSVKCVYVTSFTPDKTPLLDGTSGVLCADAAAMTSFPSMSRYALYIPLALILLMTSPTVSSASIVRVNAFLPFWSIV